MLRYLISITFFLIILPLYQICLSQEEPYPPDPQQDAPPSVCTLTIQSAISRALNYNRQLFNAIESAIKAQYGLALAEGEFDIRIAPNGQAGYVGGGRVGSGPSYGFGIDISKKFTTGTRLVFNPSFAILNTHYKNDGRVTLTQPLFRGFGREYQLSGIKGAQFALRSAHRSLYSAQVQLVLKTISTLYEVLKAEKTVELNQESYTRIAAFYEATKLKEKIGLSDALDVYRAETELRQAEDSLTSAQERLIEVKDTLKDILALPLNSEIEIELPLNIIEPTFTLDQAIELALKNRTEIDQAKEQHEENQRLSYIAKRRMYPDINFVVNYSNYGMDPLFKQSWYKRESKWEAGLTSSFDFDPASERAAYEQSLRAIQSAQRSLEQAEANIRLEVKRVLRNLERISRKIELQQKQIHTAKGEFYLAQMKFERGQATNFDLIQAEKSLRSAETNYWNALIEHIIAEYQLLAAIGLLTDKPCKPNIT